MEGAADYGWGVESSDKGWEVMNEFAMCNSDIKVVVRNYN